MHSSQHADQEESKHEEQKYSDDENFERHSQTQAVHKNKKKTQKASKQDEPAAVSREASEEDADMKKAVEMSMSDALTDVPQNHEVILDFVLRTECDYINPNHQVVL